MTGSIAILDYGSQTTQLIARRVRELQVYCELFPWDSPKEKVLEIQPSGLYFFIQGTILFLVISSDVLLRYKIELVRTAPEAVK